MGTKREFERKTRGLELLVALSFAWAGLGCQRPNGAVSVIDDGQQIVNGSPVSKLSSVGRSTVAIYLADQTRARNFCSGTLVGKRKVLTAAHCFVDASSEVGLTSDQFAQQSRVGFGNRVVQSTADSRVQFYEIANVVVHPKYVENSVQAVESIPMYDVAVITLAEDAPSWAKVAPIVTDSNLLQKGSRLKLAGFGLTSTSPMRGTTVLREVDVLINEPAFSITQFTYSVVGGRSACSGDSGGPAYIRDDLGRLAVIGVTSWGDGQCRQIGAYTSIPSLSEWIGQNIQ